MSAETITITVRPGAFYPWKTGNEGFTLRCAHELPDGSTEWVGIPIPGTIADLMPYLGKQVVLVGVHTITKSYALEVTGNRKVTIDEVNGVPTENIEIIPDRMVPIVPKLKTIAQLFGS